MERSARSWLETEGPTLHLDGDEIGLLLRHARRQPLWPFGGVKRSERQPKPKARAVKAAGLGCIGLLVAIGIIAPSLAQAQQTAITRDSVLQDRDGPMGGNPKGDVTIIAFLDYNCPFCKKSDPELERLIKADGKIRLVYKDWPILSSASTHGAELALAARYQGKYEVVHDALMRIPGGHINSVTMDRALRMSGVDINRLDEDLKRHFADIQALLRHNNDQARALGLKGVPVFLIGPFDVASALDYVGFKKVIADARMLQGK